MASNSLLNMTPSTVAQYLAALPADRRAVLSAVHTVINENLPNGYEEGIQFGNEHRQPSLKLVVSRWSFGVVGSSKRLTSP